MNTETTVLAWHFVGHTLRNGAPVPPNGEWLEYDGECVMCESGLHGSKRLIDALRYAPGNVICRDEFADIVDEHDDKFVCRRRRILWRVDGRAVLRAFARWCALQVIDAWDAPTVVREWLLTGDESKREAAYSPPYSASCSAAWSAARTAAYSASCSAHWAAWSAARTAAYSASCSAAYLAARTAAWSVQDAQLTQMVEEAHSGKTQWIWNDQGEAAK